MTWALSRFLAGSIGIVAAAAVIGVARWARARMDLPDRARKAGL